MLKYHNDRIVVFNNIVIYIVINVNRTCDELQQYNFCI